MFQIVINTIFLQHAKAMVYEFMAEKEQQLQVRKLSLICLWNFDSELTSHWNDRNMIYRKAVVEEVAVETSVKITIHVRGIPK